MKSLTLRIYLTVIAVLMLFAGVSSWLFQRQVDAQRARADFSVSERLAAWGELVGGALPPAGADATAQAEALEDWSQRLRMPFALDAADGRRIAESESYVRRMADATRPTASVRLADGRRLWVARPGRMGPDGERRLRGAPPSPWLFPAWPGGWGLLVLLALLFVAIAGAAWPVAHALTRRLEQLRRGVERFGAGDLGQRVEVGGSDEVAAVAQSFNAAAARIESLLRAHQGLLANASHELRSPLARLKMAVALLGEAAGPARAALLAEIETNVGELDALVEEVLLASRLDAAVQTHTAVPLDLLGLAAEEAARAGAPLEGVAVTVAGDERLLRRAMRNLIENAQRYGGGAVALQVARSASGPLPPMALLRVCDRGPGVPAELRDRIFEPFFRLAGHAEKAGGVGLGLSLVRQIAERHGGSVHCAPRDGGGSCFELRLPITDEGAP